MPMLFLSLIDLCKTVESAFQQNNRAAHRKSGATVVYYTYSMHLNGCSASDLALDVAKTAPNCFPRKQAATSQ